MRDGWALDPKHLREQALGDRQRVAVNPVAHHQQPARQPLFERMHAIAGTRQQDLFYEGMNRGLYEIAEGRRRLQGPGKRRSRHPCRRSGYLHKQSDRGDLGTEKGLEAGAAFSTDRGRLRSSRRLHRPGQPRLRRCDLLLWLKANAKTSTAEGPQDRTGIAPALFGDHEGEDLGQLRRREETPFIKGRAYGHDAKPGQRLGIIKRGATCDRVLLVLLDNRTLELREIWEAPMAAVDERLRVPVSKAHDRGALGVREFKKLARRVWPKAATGR
jgi:hypothetical protein